MKRREFIKYFSQSTAFLGGTALVKADWLSTPDFKISVLEEDGKTIKSVLYGNYGEPIKIDNYYGESIEYVVLESDLPDYIHVEYEYDTYLRKIYYPKGKRATIFLHGNISRKRLGVMTKIRFEDFKYG